MVGQKHVTDLLSQVPLAVHLDATYLSDPITSIPMLASNFALYDKYFVHKMELEFVPSQPVTVGGTIGMAPDYDPIDPMPLSKNELSSSFNYVSGAITKPLRCKMPNFKGPDGAYVRPALYCAPISDDRFNSFGQFKIFGEATGVSVGDSVGRLVLHYDVSFMLPEPQHVDLIGTEASVVTQLKSVGSSDVHKCNMIISATNSDVLQLTNAAGDPVSAIPDFQYSGYVDVISALMPMATATGKVINPGTRIYFKPAAQSIGSTTMADLASTALVGAISLSRTFQAAAEIMLKLSNTEVITLRNVRRWNSL